VEAIGIVSFAKRGLMILALASLAASSLVGVAYMSGWLGSATPEPEQMARSMDRPADARQPRPRPEEPMATGSLGARPSARPISSDYTRLGEARLKQIEDLRRRAVAIAETYPDCDEVAEADIAHRLSTLPDEIAFYIRCIDGTAFNLTEAEINAVAPPTLGVPPIQDAEVVAACESGVRNGLPYPSSLTRRSASTSVRRAPGGAVVTFDFDAVNGFGFPLSQRVQCTFNGDRIARLEVSSR
jgi:hypothetical protein